MKKFNTLALAAILAIGMGSAIAGNGNGNNGNGNGNGGAVAGGVVVAGGVAAQGQQTSFTGTINAATSSQSEGNAVSATRVNGNGYSSQQTTSIGIGSASAGGQFSQSGVTTNTGQTGISNVISNGVTLGNTPAVDANGLIVNGTAGLAQVTNNAVSNGSFSETAKGGAFSVSGIAGIGGVAGIVAIH